jgi:hypothetical protein
VQLEGSAQGQRQVAVQRPTSLVFEDWCTEVESPFEMIVFDPRNLAAAQVHDSVSCATGGLKASEGRSREHNNLSHTTSASQKRQSGKRFVAAAHHITSLFFCH